MLKKADREADFFFMNGYDVDGISVWSVVVAEPPLFRQHFFQFCSVIAGRIFATGGAQGFGCEW